MRMKTTTKQSEPGTQAGGSIQLSDMERTLLSNFRQLNEEGQEVVCDVITGFLASGDFNKNTVNLNWYSKRVKGVY